MGSESNPPDDIDIDQVAEKVADRLEDKYSSKISRRAAIGGLLGVGGLGAMSGSASAQTTVGGGEAADAMSDHAAPHYAAPTSEIDETVSNRFVTVTQDDAGLGYSAGDLVRTTGSGIELVSRGFEALEAGSVNTGKVADNYVTVATDGEYSSLPNAITNEPRGQRIRITEDYTVSEDIYPKHSQTIEGRAGRLGETPEVTVTVGGDYAFIFDKENQRSNGDWGRRATLKNLVIDGVDKTPTRGVLLGKDAKEIELDNVYIGNCQRAIEADGQYQNTVRRCFLADNDYGIYADKTKGTVTGQLLVTDYTVILRNMTTGLWMGNAQDFQFESMAFAPENGKHIVLDGGTDSQGNDTQVQTPTFRGCHIENSDNYGVEMHRVKSATFIGNQFRKNGQDDSVSCIVFNPDSGDTVEEINLIGNKESGSGNLGTEVTGAGTVRDIFEMGNRWQSGHGNYKAATPPLYDYSNSRFDTNEGWFFRQGITMRSNFNLSGNLFKGAQTATAPSDGSSAADYWIVEGDDGNQYKIKLYQ